MTGVQTCALPIFNRITSDNRLINLRECNQRTNNLNRDIAPPKHGYYGVSPTKTDKWQSVIKVNGKRITLGTFNTFEEAVSARKQAETQYSN